MANESKVAGVAAAVKQSKGKPAKKRKKPVRKPKAQAPKTSKPRKKKGTAAPKKTQKAPVSGQSGPPLELSVDGLNAKEAKVFAALNGEGAGARPIMTITELATACFKSRGKKQSNSWTRNSLRRLVQAGLVEKAARGQYRVSDVGRKKLSRAA